MGWWAQGDGAGYNEQDFVEWTNYVNPGPGTSLDTVWINHVTSVEQDCPDYNMTAQTDGLSHRWTTLIDGNAHTVTTFLDGVNPDPTNYPSGFSYPWLATWPNYYLNLILSHALRNPQYPPPAGQAATFTGSHDCIVRSVACYQDTPHHGTGIVGGGIALGTEVS